MTEHFRSRFIGLIWLLSCLLFLITALLFVTHDNNWSLAGFVSIIVFQTAIIRSWKQAKYGIVLNAMLLIIVIIGFGSRQFDQVSARKARLIYARSAGQKIDVLNQDMLVSLPAIVQKWLVKSGSVGKPVANTIRLLQEGVLRTGPQTNWMAFTAREYFTVNDPAFVWKADICIKAGLRLAVLDNFDNGNAALSVKFLSLYPIANVVSDPKTDTASMQRWLAEIIWFPSAAASSFLTWTANGPVSATATMHYRNMMVSGLFTFTTDGDVLSFSANRYYGSGPEAQQEKWYIQSTEWNVFRHIRMPSACSITWQLAAGDFTWANIKITDIAYNTESLYP